MRFPSRFLEIAAFPAENTHWKNSWIRITITRFPGSWREDLWLQRIHKWRSVYVYNISQVKIKASGKKDRPGFVNYRRTTDRWIARRNGLLVQHTFVCRDPSIPVHRRRDSDIFVAKGSGMSPIYAYVWCDDAYIFSEVGTRAFRYGPLENSLSLGPCDPQRRSISP